MTAYRDNGESVWNMPWHATDQRMRVLETLAQGRLLLSLVQSRQYDDRDDTELKSQLDDFEYALLNLLARLEGFV